MPLADGQIDKAAELRDQAFDQAPTSSGRIDDDEFEWIADADERLGPVLEVFLNGRYYWIPFEHVHVVDMDPPEDLRDLVWTPAQFQWANGGDAVGFIPTRYPGTEASNDDRLRMSRITEWLDPDGDEGVAIGLGQRILATDQNEYPLLATRKIRLGSAALSEESAGGED